MMTNPEVAKANPSLILLGIAQDGGVPHIGTESPAWSDPSLRRRAACLGIIDPETDERWMIEATPDIRDQLHSLDEACRNSPQPPLQRRGGAGGLGGVEGVLITHAHVGHYLGLAFLGKEMLHARDLPVYAMPRMRRFLSENLPWSDLVRRGNIRLRELGAHTPVALNGRVTITPIPVPHRDEYSETVGFRIEGPNRSVLFIPDIDRWEDWDAWGERIEDRIASVNRAYLDGTFFSGNELSGRDMSGIPHPTVASSMRRFQKLSEAERRKIRFIHLNHTNPLLDPQSRERKLVQEAGFGIAEELETLSL